MADNITFRIAKESDIDFVVEAAVEAEKSRTGTLSFARIFDLDEKDVYKILREIILEDIRGQELALSHFMITEINGEYAGASSGWIEGIEGPSEMIKANVLAYYIPEANFKKALPILEMVKPIHFPREEHALQFECVYLRKHVKSFRLSNQNLLKQIEFNLGEFPSLRKSQGQVSMANELYVRLLAAIGYRKVKETIIENDEILNYLPSKGRVLVEKIINPNEFIDLK